MANYFQHSDNLSVFPSAYRVYDGGSKFTSEKNIANLIRALISTDKDPLKDKDSFVVGDVGNNRFAVIVRGYYFEWDSAFNNGKHNLRVKLVNIQSGYLVTEGGSTVLDDSDQFLALEYIMEDKSSDQNYLQVILNDDVVNTGYIPGLMDKNGNWIDLHLILDSETNYTTINQQSINFNTDSILPTYVEGASKLIDAITLDDINEGTANRPVYFKDGIPIAMNPNVNIGYDTSTPNGIVPIWFDKNNGFKAISGTQGTNAKPVWVDNGTIKPISGTVGGTSKPIYLDNGEFKEVAGSMSSAGVSTGAAGALAYYSNSTTISKFPGKGSDVQPIYINSNGEPQNTSYTLNAKVSAGSSAGRLAYYNGTTNLQSYNSTKGATNKPIYLSNGVPTELSVIAGVNMGTIGGTTAPGKAQSAIVSSGVISGGQRFYVSTGARPTGTSTTYKTGDIWFQIES